MGRQYSDGTHPASRSPPPQIYILWRPVALFLFGFLGTCPLALGKMWMGSFCFPYDRWLWLSVSVLSVGYSEALSLLTESPQWEKSHLPAGGWRLQFSTGDWDSLLLICLWVPFFLGGGTLVKNGQLLCPHSMPSLSPLTCGELGG